jgi:putative DNA-invertase from lambdoid prophage Rac
MKTVLYARVSTLDQTLEHQRTQAIQAGFKPDLVLADHGISGVSTRLRERPDDTVRDFIRRQIRVETVINRMIFDGATKDPMQEAVRDSLIAFMAAMAQAQAEVTKEAQKAGIAHAQEHDDGTKYRGRKPTFTPQQFALVRELLNQGIAISAISKTTGLKRQSVYRIQSDPDQQQAALRSWYPTAQ